MISGDIGRERDLPGILFYLFVKDSGSFAPGGGNEDVIINDHHMLVAMLWIGE